MRRTHTMHVPGLSPGHVFLRSMLCVEGTGEGEGRRIAWLLNFWSLTVLVPYSHWTVVVLDFTMSCAWCPQGLIEYWSGTDYTPPTAPTVSFSMKMETDLFGLAKTKVKARSLEVQSACVSHACVCEKEGKTRPQTMLSAVGNGVTAVWFRRTVLVSITCSLCCCHFLCFVLCAHLLGPGAGAHVWEL